MPQTSSSLRAIDLLNIGNLQPSDVIAARNSAAHKHPGNVKYNALVREHGPLYQASKKRDDKSRLTRKIIQTVEEEFGGKFVKLVDNDWVEISNAEKHEKVSHALRSKAYGKRKIGSKSPQKNTAESAATVPVAAAPTSFVPSSWQLSGGMADAAPVTLAPPETRSATDMPKQIDAISPVSLFNLMDQLDVLLGSQHDSKSDMDFLLDGSLPCPEVTEDVDSFNDTVSTLSSEDSSPARSLAATAVGLQSTPPSHYFKTHKSRHNGTWIWQQNWTIYWNGQKIPEFASLWQFYASAYSFLHVPIFACPNTLCMCNVPLFACPTLDR